MQESKLKTIKLKKNATVSYLHNKYLFRRKSEKKNKKEAVLLVIFK